MTNHLAADCRVPKEKQDLFKSTGIPANRQPKNKKAGVALLAKLSKEYGSGSPSEDAATTPTASAASAASRLAMPTVSPLQMQWQQQAAQAQAAEHQRVIADLERNIASLRAGSVQSPSAAAAIPENQCELTGNPVALRMPFQSTRVPKDGYRHIC